ncbi:galaxin-like isoform X2 [Mizuhopecten yessoensis]|uniref:galaxin-like isoform X2 n=1 Tax=Mizuhopecten yessoensis TaxID=6573 RepID=UPI000B45F5E8|nr:galaxin-like isoform X2 [Mizuhopecten yessoensis]
MEVVATDSCQTPFSIQKCGGRTLNQWTEFCCNHQAYSKNSKQCCCVDSISDRQVLHTEEMICCGGQLHNKTDSFGEQRECCGAKVYSTSDRRKLCCRPHQVLITKSKVQPLLHHYNPDLYPNRTVGCCGNAMIDEKTQMCCNSIINNIKGSSSDWFCCNTTAFNQMSHICNKKDPNNYVILPQYYSLCSGTRYDTRINTCCNGKLHPHHHKDQFKCCGTEIMNKETQKCCNETSLIISKCRQCCGNHPTGIDISEQRCCRNPLNPSTFHVHRITTEAQYCCGNGLYNFHTQFCCRGQPYLYTHYKRCGNHEQCVGVGHQETCCGVHRLTTQTHTCCKKEFPVAKTSGGQDACCYNPWNRSGESYVSETHQCVRGRVEVKAKRCLHDKYDDNSDLCCYNNLFRGAKETGKRCCGFEVYDNRTQRCCSSKVFNGTECPAPQQNSECSTLCSKNRRMVAEKINNGEFDSEICKLKLAYVAEVRRQVVNFDNQVMKYVIRRPSRNIFTGLFEIHHRYILLPWICKKNFSRMIIVTSNPDDKTRELNCFEKDIVLPYSKRIKRAVKQRKMYHC